MRTRNLLILTLLVAPLLLASAQGALVEFALCEGPACADVASSGAVTAATVCVREIACAAATACAYDPECVGAVACHVKTPCAETSPCDVVGTCEPAPCRANVGGDADGITCELVAPCDVETASASARPAAPRCVPRPPPIGWNACRGAATEFTLRLFTARGANGYGTSAGTVDSLWRAVAYPPANNQPATLSGPAYSKGVNPIPGTWVSDAGSSWINSYAAVPGRNGPSGEYVFEARYMIPSDAYGVTLSGRYAMDNDGHIADTSVLQSTLVSVSGTNAFAGWTAIPVTPLATGPHTLTAEVWNRHANSPVGVNVQAFVHGYCKPKGPDGTACTNGEKDFRFLLNTGIDANGDALPANRADPHWTADAAGAAVTLGSNPKPGTWVSDPTSSWIANVAGAAGQSMPARVYAYEVRYTLPANAYAVQVTGKVAADNSGIVADTDAFQSRLVAVTPDPLGFRSWTSFSYPVTTNGAHVFSVSVENLHGPTGLNVVAEVTGRCGYPAELPEEVKDFLA